MKAEPGRTYAQIIDGRVHWKFTGEQLPEWNDDHVPALDVTDITPQPVKGDYYKGGVFFSDPGPPPSEYHVLDLDTYTWALMGPAAIDTIKTEKANADLDEKKMRTVFETLFVLVNDVRVLKGQAPVTRTVLRDQMIAFYKTI